MGLRSVAKMGGIMGVGMGVMDGAMTFYDRRQTHPEESRAMSLGYAGINAAGWYLMPGVMWAQQGYEVAKSLGEAGVFDRNTQQSKRMPFYEKGGSWNYQDTQTAATMRQRGLDAINQGRMTARSALGGEARALHRGAL